MTTAELSLLVLKPLGLGVNNREHSLSLLFLELAGREKSNESCLSRSSIYDEEDERERDEIEPTTCESLVPVVDL